MILLIFLGSCLNLFAQSSESSVKTSPPEAVPAPLQYKLTCTGSECHSSVAGLVSESGLCTAFLVSEDTVITNNHCIPTSIKQDGASCLGKIKFVFPAINELKTEEIECESVKRISETKSDTMAMDIAILRMKKSTQRPPFQVSLEGINDTEEVQVIKINPIVTGGEMKSVKCYALQDSLANPFYTSKYSPLFLIRDCEIMKGNSGSPMLNKFGHVVGVISAVGATSLNNAQQIQGHISLGSNLSCFRDLAFTNNFKIPDECKVDLSKEAQKVAEKKVFEKQSVDLQTKLVDTVNKELVIINGNYHKLMQLKWVETKLMGSNKAVAGVKINFEPECLFPRVKNFQEYDERLRETSKALSFTYEEILGSLELSPYLVPISRVTKSKKNRLLTLNVDEAKTTGQFITRVFDENGQKLSDKKLPFCNLRVEKN